MRKLFVSMAICVSFSFSSAQAQSPASNGDRPLVGGQGFLISDIDQSLVKQFNTAWHQCINGSKHTEAVVLVLREPDGSIKSVSPGRSNQAYEFTFKWNPGTIAVFHTHPNNRPPQPSQDDIIVARRFGVPIFTLSSAGMFLYDPATDRITKVKSGIDWLDSSSWKNNEHWAIKEPSSR